MNQFDQALGYYDGMGGGFIKNALKKLDKARRNVTSGIVKVVRSVTSPIAKVIVPKAIRKIGEDLDRKGINKIAAGIALSVFNPVAGAGALANVARMGAQLTVASSVRSGAKMYATSKVNEQAVRQAVADASNIGNIVKESPEFKTVVDQMRAAGYSDAQISQQLADSQIFQDATSVAVKNAVLPTVQSQIALNPQIPAEYVPQVADAVSTQIADDATKQAKAKAGGTGPLLAIAAVIATALVGG